TEDTRELTGRQVSMSKMRSLMGVSWVAHGWFLGLSGRPRPLGNPPGEGAGVRLSARRWGLPHGEPARPIGIVDGPRIRSRQPSPWGVTKFTLEPRPRFRPSAPRGWMNLRI